MRTKVFSAASLALVVLMASVANASDEKLAFVFEIVRHGARSPLIDEGMQFFEIDQGILTAEGQRQRYLLGRNNRKRYTEDYEFLNPDYDLNEIYMQSTQVNRTIQSGYSELMGLFPPGESGDKGLSQFEHIALNSGRSFPPFKVRDADSINKKLDRRNQTLPYGFVGIPIPNYPTNYIRDDLQDGSCPYTGDAWGPRTSNPNTFKQWQYLQDDSKTATAKALGISLADASCPFFDYYHYCDSAVSENFEGVFQVEDYYTPKQWNEAYATQKVVLIEAFTDQGWQLMCSRIMRKPMMLLRRRVALMLGNPLPADKIGNWLLEEQQDTLKFMIYSAHDTQLINMYNWLSPLNLEEDYVNYASTNFFELRYSESCLNGPNANESCFRVGVIFNGVELVLNGCDSTGGCGWDDFLNFMDNIWYDGYSVNDLNEACEQPWDAPYSMQGKETFVQ